MFHPYASGEFGVVKDPEIKFSQSGSPWVRIRVVSKDRQKDSNGTWADTEPYFLDIVAFGRYAENIAESVCVGDTLIAIGKIEVSERTDDNGQKHTNTRLKADILGVSVAWTPAKTDRMLEQSGLTAPKAPSGGAEGDSGTADSPF